MFTLANQGVELFSSANSRPFAIVYAESYGDAQALICLSSMQKSLARCLALLAPILLIPSVHADPAAAQQPDQGQGPVKLPPPDFHVKLKPELLQQHPRIYFTGKELSAIKEKLKDPRLAETVGYFKADVARAMTVPIPPDAAAATKGDMRHWEGTLEQLAFAYLITGDDRYLARWRTVEQAVLGWQPWGEDLDAGHLCFGLAVSYDWLYSQLSADERTAIESRVTHEVRNLLRNPKTGRPQWWNTAYFQNHCWINHTAISVAAMALYDKNPIEAQSWLDESRGNFEQTYRNIGLDGGYHEGASYARYGTTWMLYYVESLRHMTGENLFDMPFLKRAGDYFCQTLMPDGANLANFGDCPPTSWTRTIEDQILVGLAAEYHDGHLMQLRLLNRAKNKPPIESAFALIWIDPSVEPKPLDDLPLVGLFPDIGLVVSRTSWTSDAAVVALHCGAPGGQHLVEDTPKLKNATANNGHTHPDANSYVFWADHGWRIGLPGAYTYLKDTHNENTWIVSGKGQRGDGQIWFEQKSYMGRPDQAHLMTVATSPEADYMVGEASPAYYDDLGLTEYRRHLLFVKAAKPYIVTFDRLTAKTPQTWASFLHTFTPVTITDETNFTIAPEVQDATPSFGAVYGPGKVDLTTAPLMVLREHTTAPAQHGFEIKAAPQGTSDETWLVTVVGVDKQECALVKPGPAPEIKVGADDIAWTATDEVSLNGKTISGNLMPRTAAADVYSDNAPSMMAGDSTSATNAVAAPPPSSGSPAAGGPTGPELLTNPDFSNSTQGWETQSLNGAEGTFEVKNTDASGNRALCVTVAKPAEKRYYVQFFQSIYTALTSGKSYTFSFRAKSNPPLPIAVVVKASAEPPGIMLRKDPVQLTGDWADYTYTFTASADSLATKITLTGLGANAGEYWFTNISLRESGGGANSGAPPSTTSTANPPPGERTPASIPGAETFIYRDGTPEPMRLFVFKPTGWKATDHRPALVFYFGGGWTHGNPTSADIFPRRAAELGFVGVAPDYRTKARFNTTPYASVADARAALRWVQDHAAELGIDPAKIVVGGHSAGGHVALWTAITHTPPESDPNEAPHNKPAALFLLAPCSDTSRETGYTPWRFAPDPKALSPIHQLDGKMPPTLLFQADTDEILPYRQSVALAPAIVATGAVCDFETVTGGNHSFPWQHKGYDVNTLIDKLMAFLEKNGVISEKDVVVGTPVAAHGA